MADLVFKINGADYPIVDVAQFVTSLTIDECGIYHQWTGTLIEDIADQPVNSLMVAAFMQIAYMRGNPGLGPQAARQAVGESNLTSALASFTDSSEDDARPPEQGPSGPGQTVSLESRPASQHSSGTASTVSSATPPAVPRRSGSPPWALSATSGSPRSAT